MPIYEYECNNPNCVKDNKPLEFEGHQPLANRDEPVGCPNCMSTDFVKKVIRSTVPKSMTWKT